MLKGKARLCTYKWLLNNRLVWHLRMQDELFFLGKIFTGLVEVIKRERVGR